ncbi:CoA transferase [Dactylosporangium sp. NPDC051485]|uniref:CoA transferase n=1 Tax=Dactylosporangium sp. NPDC051485 TaxID=3154846 RepID=UPI003448D0A6
MQAATLPLSGIRVVERGHGVAAAYAGRLLGTLGADVLLIEPPGGSALRRLPPFFAERSDLGVMFAYLSAGKRSIVCDEAAGLDRLLSEADVLLDDALSTVDATSDLTRSHPDLVVVSVRPFGLTGPKAGWAASELNLIHAASEGFLMPNGLSAEMFPQAPPLKIHGHFAELQGGTAAALAALAALWARPAVGGQLADVSIQDAAVALAAFAVQRHGDGSVEHRSTRSFRYGGVVECADGYVELLTLEERQWAALVELMGRPGWATVARYDDPVERGLDGPAINARIREWAKQHDVRSLVERAQALGLPMAKYDAPREVLDSPHTLARGTTASVEVDGLGPLRIVTSPYLIDGQPLELRSGPPALDSARADPGPWPVSTVAA